MAVGKGIKHIWVQQGAESIESIKFANLHDANIIFNECILMFAEPVSFVHRFHRGITKLFGKYPKMQ